MLAVLYYNFVLNFCRKLRHPNIIQFIGHTPLERPSVYVLMEYFPNKSLDNVLYSNVNLPIPTIFQMAIDVAIAIHYLHSNKIIHRDIKPANIMVRFVSKSC
jgi:serine/threonine protein kinase